MRLSESENTTNWWHWLLLAGVILVAGWLRYRLIGVPLERDEGEYAYGGQLLLQGVPPYKLLFNMKLPGIYAAYAGILALFGQTHSGIHQGLIAVNGATTFALFLLGRRVLGGTGAVAASAAFAVLSIGAPVQGMFANAEHFVILPVVVGAIVLHHGLISRKLATLFVAGFFLGVGFVVKQHGVVFIVWAAAIICWNWFANSNRRVTGLIQSILPLVGGVVTPYLITCLLLWRAGVFEKFWFWTFEYARLYASQVTLGQAWDSLRWKASLIMAASPLLWGGAALGLPLAAKLRGHGNSVFVGTFALFSFLAICPGGFFRPHYFVLLLPAAALLFGVSIAILSRGLPDGHNPLLKGGLPVFVTIIALCSSLYVQRSVLFQMTPAQISSSIYWPNPFNESLEIAKFLKAQSEPGQTVAVIGSEPQIPFYSGLHSATGYIYMYPLMEAHEYALTMQREVIREVEAASPDFLLFVRIPLSWLQKKGSHDLVYQWFSKYKENYERIGMVEIFEKNTRYSWAPEVVWPPSTPYWIEILRRKGEKNIH